MALGRLRTTALDTYSFFATTYLSESVLSLDKNPSCSPFMCPMPLWLRSKNLMQRKSDTKAYLEMGLHALIFSMAQSRRGLMFYSVIDMPETWPSWCFKGPHPLERKCWVWLGSGRAVTAKRADLSRWDSGKEQTKNQAKQTGTMTSKKQGRPSAFSCNSSIMASAVSLGEWGRREKEEWKTGQSHSNSI